MEVGWTPARGALATLADRIERLRHTLATPMSGESPSSASIRAGEEGEGTRGKVMARGGTGGGEEGMGGSPAMGPMRMMEREASSPAAVKNLEAFKSVGVVERTPLSVRTVMSPRPTSVGAAEWTTSSPGVRSSAGPGTSARSHTGTLSPPTFVHTPVGAGELEAARRAREVLQARLRRDGVVLGGSPGSARGSPGAAAASSPLGRTSSSAKGKHAKALGSDHRSFGRMAEAMAGLRAEVAAGGGVEAEWEAIKAIEASAAAAEGEVVGRLAVELRDTLGAMLARTEAMQARAEAAEARLEAAEGRNGALEVENDKLARAFEIADRRSRPPMQAVALEATRPPVHEYRENLSALDEALREKALLKKAGDRGVLRTPLKALR